MRRGHRLGAGDLLGGRMTDPTAPPPPGEIASDSPPRGFASRAGKRAVLRLVLIVGGALVAIQIVVPLVSMVAMIGAMFDGLGQTVARLVQRFALRIRTGKFFHESNEALRNLPIHGGELHWVGHSGRV